MLLNNQWVIEEVKKYLQTNENKYNIPRSLEYGKNVLRGMILALEAYLKKEEKYQTNFIPKDGRKRTKEAQRQ